MGRTYTPEQVRKRYIKQIVKDGNTRIAWHLTYPADAPQFEMRPKRFFGECPKGKHAMRTWSDRFGQIYHTRLASLPRKVYWSVRPASGVPVRSVWSAVYGNEVGDGAEGKLLYMTRSRYGVTRFTTSRKGWIRNRRRLRHKGTFKVYAITALLTPEEHTRAGWSAHKQQQRRVTQKVQKSACSKAYPIGIIINYSSQQTCSYRGLTGSA